MRRTVLQFEPLRDEHDEDELPFFLDRIEAEKALGGCPDCNCSDCKAIRERVEGDRGSYDFDVKPQVALGKCPIMGKHGTLYDEIDISDRLPDSTRLYMVNESRIADVIRNARRNSLAYTAS